MITELTPSCQIILQKSMVVSDFGPWAAMYAFLFAKSCKKSFNEWKNFNKKLANVDVGSIDVVFIATEDHPVVVVSGDFVVAIFL